MALRFLLHIHLECKLTGTVSKDIGKRLNAVSLDNFNREDILAFLTWLRRERGNAVTTVNQRLSHLKGFCRYVAEKDMLSALVYKEVKEISEEKDTRIQDFVWMSLEDVRLMMEQPNTKKKTEIRDRLFIALLYKSGCWDDEMLHLKMKGHQTMYSIF